MNQDRSKGRKIRSIQKPEQQNTRYGSTEFPKDEPGVIYVRQSGIAQVQNNIHSFEMQTDKFVEHFRNRGCTGEIEIVADDEGMSGTMDIHKMPGLTRVMKLIEGKELLHGKKIGWAAAVHVNRFTRDKWLVKPGTIMKACYENNIWIATLRMDFNFQDEYCQRVFMIEAEESARHLEWMKLILGGALNTASSKGYYDGRWLAPGYIVDRSDEKKKKYVIYEPHAEGVRWLFRRFFELDGDFPQLRKEVAQKPFLFPAFEAWVGSKNIGKFVGNRKKKGSLITEGPYAGNYASSRDGLKSILTNPVYIGWWLPRAGGVVLDNHAPIVEEYLFVFAHKLLSTYDLNGERQKSERVRRSGKAENILKKVLFDDQGRPMYAYNDSDTSYYRGYIENSLTVSYGFAIGADALDQVFLEKLFERIRVLEKMEKWSDRLRERQTARLQEQENKANLIRKQIDNATRRRVEIMDTLGDPDIPKSKQMKIDYANQVAGLEKKIHQWELELEKSLSAEEDEETTLYEICSLLPNIKAKWHKLRFDVRLRFVGALVKKVVLTEVAPSWIKIAVYWKSAIGNFVDEGYIKRSQANRSAWTPEEDAILRSMYHHGEAAEILALLPSRSWKSIRMRACILKLSRERHKSLTIAKEVKTLMDQKYEEEHGIVTTDKKAQWRLQKRHR